MSYPDEWETEYTTKNGVKVVLRPELCGDLEMLWEMFSTLSEESVSNLLPPITRERVESWTENIDYYEVLPIVALVTDEGRQRIVGSGILRFNEQEALMHKAELGLSIHDDYQNMGIGTALLAHLIRIAKKKNLVKIYLHVRTANDRAIYVYTKAGFIIEGKLCKESCINGEYKDEYRMALFL